MARYRVKKEFEHFPTDGDPDKPSPVVAKVGDSVDNIHESSVQWLLDNEYIEETGKKSTAGEA